MLMSRTSVSARVPEVIISMLGVTATRSPAASARSVSVRSRALSARAMAITARVAPVRARAAAMSRVVPITATPRRRRFRLSGSSSRSPTGRIGDNGSVVMFARSLSATNPAPMMSAGSASTPGLRERSMRRRATYRTPNMSSRTKGKARISVARGMPITGPSGMTTSDSASASATTMNASVRTSSKDP